MQCPQSSLLFPNPTLFCPIDLLDEDVCQFQHTTHECAAADSVIGRRFDEWTNIR